MVPSMVYIVPFYYNYTNVHYNPGVLVPIMVPSMVYIVPLYYNYTNVHYNPEF